MLFRSVSVALALMATVTFAHESFGSIIAQYQVHSTSVVNGHDVNGNDAPHGLWTSGDAFGSSQAGNAFYDIQSMLFTQYSDGTSTLIGTAVNPYGTVAEIALTFGSFASTVPQASFYKQEQGLAYDPNLHDFYETVSGSITLTDTSSQVSVINIDHFVNDYRLQFGLGANAKNAAEYGGSAWLQDSQGGMQSHHWDLNLVFQPVPEPSTLVVWSLLATAVVPLRRRLRR